MGVIIMKIEYEPVNVCSKKITFDIDDGKIHNMKFFGGCPGNLSAIAKLVEGADARIVAQLLRGNQCGGRGTSCADQLALAIDSAMNE